MSKDSNEYSCNKKNSNQSNQELGMNINQSKHLTKLSEILSSSLVINLCKVFTNSNVISHFYTYQSKHLSNHALNI